MRDDVPKWTLAFEDNLSAFLYFLRIEDSPELISPWRFSMAFDLDPGILAQLAQVSPPMAMRAPANERLQHFLRESVRIISEYTAISGDVEKSLFWFKNHALSCFNGKTPLTLVSVGRTHDLIRYLQALVSRWGG